MARQFRAAKRVHGKGIGGGFRHRGFPRQSRRTFGELEYYRLVMLPVEATLPRIDEEEEEEKQKESSDENEPWNAPRSVCV
ncbi:MAG: hypothetical protein JJU41_05135 [Bacteroidetes bacterium]|nr:hypothetical protein [Bacteroidota bacterium]MCH8524547.1 hypothetical protein [Balneolales bacterium]